MNFYWFNSNEKRHKGGFRKWITHGFGFAGDDVKLDAFSPGDLVFMYVNEMGVKAVGMVMKSWDRVMYNQPIIPSERSERGEHRIEINWFIVLDDCIPHKDAMMILEWKAQIRTIAGINVDKGEKLLRCVLKKLE